MKKKVIIGILIALIVATVSVSAKGIFDYHIFQKLSVFEKVIKIAEREFESDEEFNELMYDCKYIELGLDAPDEDTDYIYSLIVDGCDSEDIIDLYYFWLDTNEDISIIKDMYDLKEKYEGYKYWIENAFEDVTEQKYGSLDTEDIENYINKGLSVSDIEIADKLCRKGIYRIEEILNKKLEGKSFVEMACESYGEELDYEVIQYAENSEENAENIEDKIETAINLSRICDNGISYFLSLEINDIDIKELYIEENDKKSLEVFKELCRENIYKFNQKIEENKELFDKIVNEGISDEELKDLINSGVDMLDILNDKISFSDNSENEEDNINQDISDEVNSEASQSPIEETETESEQQTENIIESKADDVLEHLEDTNESKENGNSENISEFEITDQPEDTVKEEPKEENIEGNEQTEEGDKDE